MLEGVPLKGHQQSAGHTVVVAGDDGHIVFEQGRDSPRCDGNPPIVEHHHPYVFDRDGALASPLEGFGDGIILLHLGQLDNQLLLAQAEVGWIAKEEGFLNHAFYRIMRTILPKRSTSNFQQFVEIFTLSSVTSILFNDWYSVPSLMIAAT